MTEKRGEPKSSFDPVDFPALREFLPAYLHEDYAEEYEDARKAVEAFLEEASGDEILAVKEEWIRLREMLSGRALEEKQAALQKLGSAWIPGSEAEWRGVDEILTQAEA